MPLPFVPRDFFDAALLLTVRIDIDHNGEESSGTGFIVRIVDDSGMTLALISNRHVLRDGQGKVRLRFHAATDDRGRYDLGETITLEGGPVFADRYVPHPARDIDLGAAIVNAIGKEGKGETLAPEQIASAEELGEMGAGSPIWFVGYPDGWRDELHNLPLMRRGSLASLPRLPFDGRPEFVIDAQAFPGSSGSPVFAQVGDEMRLIGVLTETRVQQSLVQAPSTILGPFTVEEVIGLGIVISATELPSLLAAVQTRVVEIIEEQEAS